MLEHWILLIAHFGRSKLMSIKKPSSWTDEGFWSHCINNELHFLQ